jgi:hypothetical protein
MLPSPSLPRPLVPFWPRPISFSSTGYLLEGQSIRYGSTLPEPATSMVYAAVRTD